MDFAVAVAALRSFTNFRAVLIRVVIVGGLAERLPTFFPSFAFQTETEPVQSPATMRAPSWEYLVSMTISGNPEMVRITEPAGFQSLIDLSRPPVAKFPFLSKWTDSEPPL